MFVQHILDLGLEPDGGYTQYANPKYHNKKPNHKEQK
jgi:hypothetical protein